MKKKNSFKKLKRKKEKKTAVKQNDVSLDDNQNDGFGSITIIKVGTALATFNIIQNSDAGPVELY